MDIFRTPVKIPVSGKKISYKEKLFFIGSCFSDNIGSKLKEHKFNVLQNPLGIVYNPASLSRNIDILLSGKSYTKNDLEFHNNLYFSFDHHGKFSHVDAEICLSSINQYLKEGKKFIASADFIFITLGTPWAYELKESGNIVSNCHKLPANRFKRKFLTPVYIAELLAGCHDKIKSLNPSSKIIFTVSPIRHMKDGAIENSKGKAALISAVHSVLQHHPTISYFPAYEIMMDDLRDYRFYAKDMIHPNETAVDYIWEKFLDTYLDDREKPLMKEIRSLTLATRHKPFNPSAPDYHQFLSTYHKKALSISREYPHIDLSKELAYFLGKKI